MHIETPKPGKTVAAVLFCAYAVAVVYILFSISHPWMA